MPQANAATVADRLRRWCCFCSSGCSEHFGGARLSAASSQVKLQIHVRVTDALTVNSSIHGMEEDGWKQARDSGSGDDESAPAPVVARMVNYCLHHQASLAKRPSLLLILNLCSGLIRMCASAAAFSGGASGFRIHHFCKFDAVGV